MGDHCNWCGMHGHAAKNWNAKECLIEVQSQLAAAKAEIEELKKSIACKHGHLSCISCLKNEIHLESENKRLRDHIQRNEDKSVECERLREALENIKAIPVESTDFHEYATLKVINKIAKAALDGPRITVKELKAIVDNQAEDMGLWFMARTASEAYLQDGLRKFHAAIEALDGGDDMETVKLSDGCSHKLPLTEYCPRCSHHPMVDGGKA